jgi:hypothetical protein
VNDHHVGRLQIAVDDAEGVRGVERAQHLAHQLAGVAHSHRAAAFDHAIQRFPVAELHHHERLAGIGMPEIEHVDDVRVANATGRLGFRSETSPHLRIARQIGAEHLDRDPPHHERVFGLPDLAGIALTEQPFEPVFAAE